MAEEVNEVIVVQVAVTHVFPTQEAYLTWMDVMEGRLNKWSEGVDGTKTGVALLRTDRAQAGSVRTDISPAIFATTRGFY